MDAHRDDLLACRTILREGSRSFWAASRLLPGRIRGPVSAVYAFCRTADDEVDLHGSGPGVLESLRRRLDRVYAGPTWDDPVDRAFAATVAAHRIPRVFPEALLEGFQWDLGRRRYETPSEVLAYSARVASTVGAMMTLLMGDRRPEILARACDLGVAMQLTNIARDVGEDARQGRLYLPGTWLRDAGIDPDGWLDRPAFTPALGSVVARLLDEADALYTRSEVGIASLPADCRAAIWAARFIYADIGRVIRRVGMNSVDRRAFTSPGRKILLLLRAFWTRYTRPSAGPSDCAAPPLGETRFLVDAVKTA